MCGTTPAQKPSDNSKAESKIKYRPVKSSKVTKQAQSVGSKSETTSQKNTNPKSIKIKFVGGMIK